MLLLTLGDETFCVKSHEALGHRAPVMERGIGEVSLKNSKEVVDKCFETVAVCLARRLGCKNFQTALPKMRNERKPIVMEPVGWSVLNCDYLYIWCLMIGIGIGIGSMVYTVQRVLKHGW